MEHEGKQTEGCSSEISPLGSGGTLSRKPYLSGIAIGTLQSAARPSKKRVNGLGVTGEYLPFLQRKIFGCPVLNLAPEFFSFV
ncbi:MAG: hypothetical protein NTU79_08670 [Planctomycetota bacterium]|nr:hypothetical protein [Planctomycetota bacterium]